VINFCEAFCTFSSNSLWQDLTAESAKKKNPFGLLELEVAVLGYFLRKKAMVF
jgi:hypothetical protein